MLNGAVMFTAEHWEGGRMSAITPVSATVVHHIFPVHANFLVILIIGRFHRKFFPVNFPITSAIRMCYFTILKVP